MKEQIYEYDPAAALTDPETIALFMSDAFQTGDASYIAKALGVVARAKGMTDLAKEAGVSREQLYRSFSETGNPTLKTLVAVMTALGVDMIARPHTTL
jgi:probable addiction module antidote protein